MSPLKCYPCSPVDTPETRPNYNCLNLTLYSDLAGLLERRPNERQPDDTLTSPVEGLVVGANRAWPCL